MTTPSTPSNDTAHEATRAHIYAWAKAVGIDNWLTTADYDDLARRLAAETSAEWTWRHNRYVSTASATADRAEAERSVDRCRAANPGDPVNLMHRTVTPWTPAEVKP